MAACSTIASMAIQILVPTSFSSVHGAYEICERDVTLLCNITRRILIVARFVTSYQFPIHIHSHPPTPPTPAVLCFSSGFACARVLCMFVCVCVCKRDTVCVGKRFAVITILLLVFFRFSLISPTDTFDFFLFDPIKCWTLN